MFKRDVGQIRQNAKISLREKQRATKQNRARRDGSREPSRLDLHCLPRHSSGLLSVMLRVF